MAGAVDVVHVVIEDAEADARGTKARMMASTVHGGMDSRKFSSRDNGLLSTTKREQSSPAVARSQCGRAKP
jgi:hypothetical protein